MNTGTAPPFDLAVERNILGQALLGATALLVAKTDPETVLRTLCDTLVGASDHLRLVWMRFATSAGSSPTPEYLAGPALDSARALDLSLGNQPVDRSALERWELVATDRTCDDDPLCQAGLCSAISIPFGRESAAPNGIVTIYADQPGYFDQVGTSLFAAFLHLANVSLSRALLLGELNHLASHDQLTGLLNRRGVREVLERELARCRRRKKSFSIILFDLDRFKMINDRLGHQEGDLVLMETAARISGNLRQEDCLGRWGGEEFICVAPETCRSEALGLAERMRIGLKESPVAVTSGRLPVTASFGVASYPEDAESLDQLLAAADSALNEAKLEGRDRTVSAGAIRHDVFSIGNQLESALNEQRIVAAYQPIVDLRSGSVVAEEALARLLTAGGDVVPAGRFVPAASQLQLMHRVDLAIIMQAFSHCVAGLQSGRNRLTHFVNISTDLLRHRELIDQMLAAAYLHCRSCTGLIGEVKPIVIEITEHELLSDIEAARALLTPFIDFGFRLALDDFGSGYSSYRYLVDLPISFIKIDVLLIKRLDEPKVRAIVQGIQDTADQLGITTVAEFVEDAATEAILKEVGIHWAQGFHYGHPRISSDRDEPIPVPLP